MLRGFEKSPTDALASPFRKNRQIVDIQQRSSPECREPEKTDRDTDWTPLLDGKKHQCRRMISQGRHEALTHLCAEGFATPH